MRCDIKNQFNNVHSVDLRTWNRCTTFFNIISDTSHGSEAARRYMETFDDISIAQMKRMFMKIRDEGQSEVKRKLLKGECILGEC